MTVDEVQAFIMPQMDDPIQVTFLTIILVVMAGTIASAHMTARTASWEKKWNSGTPNGARGNLGIEHGSVTDLWHAVATAPEKVAEIMPGMLLVIGLLGTFLGLGLALNKASTILGQAGAINAGMVADSMNHLMGVLQGLGTKFKSSTWGIAGFVLLKIWSEVTRFEEKRLAWVIGKVKAELEHRKLQTAKEELAKREALHSEISNAASHIVSGLADQIGKMCTLEKEHHNGIIQVLKSLHKKQSEVLPELRANRRAMIEFSSTMLDVVKSMEAGAQRMVEGAGGIVTAADRMAQGADRVGEAANGLTGAVEDFKSQFSSVLNDVRVDLSTSIDNMSAQAASTLEKGSNQLSDATRDISAALGILSSDVRKTMNDVKDSIGSALEIQRKASNEFTLSTSVLNENIVKTTGTIGKLASPISDGLKSISEVGLQVRSAVKGMDNLLISMKSLLNSLETLPESLKPIPSIHKLQEEILLALSPLAPMLNEHKEVVAELKNLRNDFMTNGESIERHIEA